MAPNEARHVARIAILTDRCQLVDAENLTGRSGPPAARLRPRQREDRREIREGRGAPAGRVRAFARRPRSSQKISP